MKAIVALVALATTAHADTFVGAFGDYTHLGGIQAGGFGVDVEQRLHRGRWQLFGEGALAYLAVGATDAEQSGAQLRLGAGARWFPRTVEVDDGGIDLYVEGGVGATAMWWPGGRVVRPDVTIGWGWQVRLSRTRSLRSGLRVLLAHDREGLAVACRGCTMSPPETIDPGMVFVMGMSW